MTIGYFQDPARNDKLAVGTSSVIIADARNLQNPRKAILVRNTSDDPTKIITISLGLTKATAETGIVLRQNESFSDSTESGYECFQGTISGICAVIDGQVSIMER